MGGTGSGDRFFVQHYLGAQALGFYAAAYGIAIYLQDVLMAPLQLALFPICMKVWAAEGKKATQEFLSRSLDQFVLVAVGVVCIAIVTSRDAIVLLASRKFQQAHSLLPFLVVGLVLSAVTIYSGWIADSQTRVQDRHGNAVRQRPEYRDEHRAAAQSRTDWRGCRHHGELRRHCSLSGLRIHESAAFQIGGWVVCPICHHRTAVAWLATQIRIESPLLSAVAKASFTVMLYTGVLCMTDARVRMLVGKAWLLATAWVREPRAQVLETMPSVAEKKMAVNQ